jgi:hypothetical protein
MFWYLAGSSQFGFIALKAKTVLSKSSDISFNSLKRHTPYATRNTQLY